MILAVSATEIPITVHTPHPAQSSISLWAIVVAASVIITVIGGVIGVISYFSRYGQRKVERRVYQIVGAQLDAEDAEQSKQAAEQELKQLRDAKNKLEQEIRRVPEEANRLFLENQLKELADSIGRDFNEFKSVEAKLRSAQAAATLDPQIREVIETEILPTRKRQERRNTYILLLLMVLLALNLTPTHVSYYVSQYFSVLANSYAWTPDAPAWMMMFGVLVVALVLLCLNSLFPAIQRHAACLEKKSFIVVTIFLFVGTIILGYYFRNVADSDGCYYIYDCADPIVTGATVCFNAVSILGGLLAFLTLNRLSRTLWFFSRRRDRQPPAPSN